MSNHAQAFHLNQHCSRWDVTAVFLYEPAKAPACRRKRKCKWEATGVAVIVVALPADCDTLCAIQRFTSRVAFSGFGAEELRYLNSSKPSHSGYSRNAYLRLWIIVV